MTDILIKNGLVLTMDPEGTKFEEGVVAITGDRIEQVGKEFTGNSTPGRIIDAARCVVMPGLVDTHMHECLLRGFCEDLPLERWLDEICFPKDRAFAPQDMHGAALLNQMEMIRGGITTFIDIFRFPFEPARVLEQSGLRAILSPQIIEYPQGAGETVEDSEAFIAEWNGRANGRIQAWFGPHAPYSVSREMYTRIARLAKQYNVGIHTHLAETEFGADAIQKQHGLSQVELLKECGIFEQRTVAAHSIWISAADIDIMAQHNVGVAYCPSPNMKAAMGVPPIPELLEAGVNVGLGTDSILSNNNLDLFEDMRLGAILQRLDRRDAAVMSCHQMLQMTTLGGARVLGLENEIGSLEPGKKADIIIIDLMSPHFWPFFSGLNNNVIEHLVYSANAADVRTTIVDGQILMEDRKVLTLDMDEVYRETHASAEALLRRSHLWRESR